MKKLTTIFLDNNSIFSIFKLFILIINKKNEIEKIYYFEKRKLYLLKIISKIFNIQISYFEYRNFYNFVDKDKMNLGWKIQTYQAHPFIKECLSLYKSQYKKFYEKGFEKFLIKTLAAYKWPYKNETLLDILIKLNEIENKSLNNKVFITENIVFSDVFKKYSLNLGININFYDKINFFYSYSFAKNLLKFFIGKFIKKNKYNNKKIDKNKKYIIFDISLSIYKPLEFLKFKKINFENVIFVSNENFVGEKELEYIKKNNLNFIFLKKRFDNQKDIPYFYEPGIEFYKLNIFRSLNRNFLDNLYKEYLNNYYIWKNFFKKFNSNIFITDNIWSNQTQSANNAMQNLGGISISFQGSFWETPPIHAIIHSDIFMTFSPMNIEDYHNNNSFFNILIKNGYIKDYSFQLEKNNLSHIRTKILDHGAKKIIGFFDQGSTNDLWPNPHYVSKNTYVFLLNKLLENDWLGLLIKPKKPKLLRQKLGNDWELLNRAIKTNRCHVILDNHPGHVKNFTHTPGVVAKVSDICIHDMLVSATAGLEAYLSGTRSILFDYFGFHTSIFYKNNMNVAFNDYQKMWNYIENFFYNNDYTNNLGDWSNIINEIDAYKNGKSSHRLSVLIEEIFLNSLENKNRDEILSDAIEKCNNLFQSDNILINN
tara:strand:+ start:5046 stop:7001 length:1956 start_codon:yes stop_codon:yes gene_type:complete